jgi:glycosyltransferase involved in cell wall biosynthesis
VARYYARFTHTEPTPHVIPNGVHPARGASVPRAWARERLGIPSTAPVVAHLGRITLQKNVIGLLDAFEAVLEHEPAARLLLAGSLSDSAYVRKVRRAHGALLRGGAVQLLPPVPHVGAILSAADIYVSNSFFEGWSLAASEAAWNGLPLVLSDCGSARQLVGDRGERGVIVPNPLGDPLDVTWELLKAPSPATLEVNQRALSEALIDLIDSRGSWSARREGVVRHARSELAPGRVSRAYAGLLEAAVAP